MLTFGGDEVNALVLDVGHATTKCGFAGEDAPKAVFGTRVGYYADETTAMDEDVEMNAPEQQDTPKPNRKNFVGDMEINCWRERMELKTPFKDGTIQDWDAFEAILDHAFQRSLRVDTSEHPILFAEPAWWSRETREKLTEIMFEKYNVPAFYLAKSAVLSTFASGRSTGLVLDMGAGTTSVVPVYDGYVLTKGESIQKQDIGGDFISEQGLAMLKNMGIEVTPQYLVKRKERVDPGQPANFVRHERPNTTDSFHQYQLMRTMQDFKETACACFEAMFFEEHLNKQQKKAFEFPDGYNNSFGAERFKLAELMFSPQMNISSIPDTPSFKPIHQMLVDSTSSCDVDVRPHLFQNIIIVGGNSMWTGLPDRVHYSLSHVAPSARIKIHAAGHSTERRFSSWIGGSILASLGTFHQMWIGKKEYEDVGRSVVKRC